MWGTVVWPPVETTPTSEPTSIPTGELDGGAVAATAPGARYRCTACGNLTRFDVVSTRRTRAYHHYSLGGALSVEDEQVLSEAIEEVTCRWCGRGTAVERVAAGGPWGPGD